MGIVSVTCSLAGPAPFAVKQAVIIIAAKKAAMKVGFLVMNSPCESMSAPKSCRMIYGKRLPPNSHPCKEFRPLNRDRFVLPVLVDVREQLQSESELSTLQSARLHGKRLPDFILVFLSGEFRISHGADPCLS